MNKLLRACFLLICAFSPVSALERSATLNFNGKKLAGNNIVSVKSVDGIYYIASSKATHNSIEPQDADLMGFSLMIPEELLKTGKIKLKVFTDLINKRTSDDSTCLDRFILPSRDFGYITFFDFNYTHQEDEIVNKGLVSVKERTIGSLDLSEVNFLGDYIEIAGDFDVNALIKKFLYKYTQGQSSACDAEGENRAAPVKFSKKSKSTKVTGSFAVNHYYY
ncbi:MAG: hypothetical protein LW817_03380 [Candidatus Caenarcaniphilales bacterium]|jgi:hypothetical protein|nr:hypothetical protein [Candidatus Caenarcaniphilales bacterium]